MLLKGRDRFVYLSIPQPSLAPGPCTWCVHSKQLENRITQKGWNQELGLLTSNLWWFPWPNFIQFNSPGIYLASLYARPGAIAKDEQEAGCALKKQTAPPGSWALPLSGPAHLLFFWHRKLFSAAFAYLPLIHSSDLSSNVSSSAAPSLTPRWGRSLWYMLLVSPPSLNLASV